MMDLIKGKKRIVMHPREYLELRDISKDIIDKLKAQIRYEEKTIRRHLREVVSFRLTKQDLRKATREDIINEPDVFWVEGDETGKNFFWCEFGGYKEYADGEITVKVKDSPTWWKIRNVYVERKQ